MAEQNTPADVPLNERFAFGRNWAAYLDALDESKLRQAEHSLAAVLGPDLAGKSFLDIGCGSGLFSLAARRLGAHVLSLDFDPDSVRCAERLKTMFFPTDPAWDIRPGSVLDCGFMASLEGFDIVYAWGVLHHTGSMWAAMENAADRVRPGGTLFISIYNDQGEYSVRWRKLKRLYVALPKRLKPVLVLGVALFMQFRPTLGQLLRLRSPLAYWRNLRPSTRGMTYWHDLVDWVGGFPFEVAKPEDVFNFFQARGFTLTRLKTCGGGAACNEFVFSRDRAQRTPERTKT